MKKLFIFLFVASFLLTGCVKISDKSVSDIFETILYVDNNLSNTSMNGYSFYLPKGLRIIDKEEYNLIINDGRQNYYLYIDTIAYHYKTSNLYKENASHFYSKKFTHNNKDGYIDIIDNENNYFVNIMYNYAKIETFVPKEDFRKSMMYVCQILSTIKYNDAIINSYIGNKGMVYQEEKFNIFGTDTQNDNFLKYESEYGTYKETIQKTDDTVDVELIN